MRFADTLNSLGVQLILSPSGDKPDVVGSLPEGSRLAGNCGDAVDAKGDAAFFDSSNGKWYPIGGQPSS